MANPYYGQDFIGFFFVFIRRFWAFLSGTLPFDALVTDEVQVVVLASVACSGALVGTFLVLRRMTMLANALSHTILLGIVSAFLLVRLFSGSPDPAAPLSIPALVIAAFLTGVATTFLTEFLTKVIKLQEDASIGLVFSILFSLGIVLVTLFTRNVHVGIELVMGNADALQRSDIRDVLAILGVNSALFFLLFHGFKITTFDSQLARAFGFSPVLFNYLLMIQTSATAIGGFRAVGVLMILAFFTIPTLAARLFTHHLSTLVWLSMAIGVLASLAGVAFSRHFFTIYGTGLSTGGIVVTLLGSFYILAALLLEGARFLYRRKNALLRRTEI
ncbi:MAG: metal ABC transporter permease [Chlamydiales bacterium]|nr:metal ABC transporter permease [Chlamydiales bacterium]